ncbi:HlyD family secretion protein [Oceanisphaera litoralis]|uniref:HlyD family secretion protein n=1 Tax=Oceanisphaera litoralis TaxID=225144 RepID=UPI00195E054F|nr:HlyD family efflux transporter periplasmic adaptor subunit [Oceanisphaera litoralis]MBM7456681.1 HlyD family secretion protein [Oceanisphaera litoralis]
MPKFPRLILLLSCLWLTGCEPSEDERWLGTLERDRIELTATTAELVLEQPVAEGERVTAGTLLLRLDDARQRLEVDRQQARLRQAEAGLALLLAGAREQDIETVRAELSRQQARLPETERNLERIRQLATRGLASQAELDRALTELAQLQARIEGDSQRLAKIVAGSREEEIEAARAERDAIQAELALARYRLDELTIHASRPGILETLPYQTGDRVAPGAVVAVLQAQGAPYARIYVPASGRLGLKIGDSFRVWVDGIEAQYEGHLSWIATEPAFTPYYALTEGERSRLMYLARVQLPEDAVSLPSGVPAQALPEENHD